MEQQQDAPQFICIWSAPTYATEIKYVDIFYFSEDNGYDHDTYSAICRLEIGQSVQVEIGHTIIKIA
jgi:hypothetical protein